LNETQHFLAYATDINMVSENTNTTKKNKEALLEVSTEVGHELTTQETNYMVMSRHQKAG